MNHCLGCGVSTNNEKERKHRRVLTGEFASKVLPLWIHILKSDTNGKTVDIHEINSSVHYFCRQCADLYIKCQKMLELLGKQIITAADHIPFKKYTDIQEDGNPSSPSLTQLRKRRSESGSERVPPPAKRLFVTGSKTSPSVAVCK